MKTSRQRLLDYLEKKQVATAKDISQALKMTPANARHHLSILMDQGSVELAGKRTGPGRGRPHNLFRVVKSNRKNNLNNLTGILLQEVYRCNKDKNRDSVLKMIAVRLTERDFPKNLNQTQKLNEAINQLNQMDYDARWEAHIDAPQVILNNCPYITIVDEIPEICRVDKFILEKMLGHPVSQIAKLEKSPQGLRRCIFVLSQQT